MTTNFGKLVKYLLDIIHTQYRKKYHETIIFDVRVKYNISKYKNKM